jgi:hypothetical protein
MSMRFDDIMDRIIKARSEMLHADRLLTRWSCLSPGESPDANEYALLIDLIRNANENLDSVVGDMVKISAKAAGSAESTRSRFARRLAAHSSRPS